MKLTRLTLLSLLAIAAVSACSGEKVKPEGAEADSSLTPEQRDAKHAAEYAKKQQAFTDSVLSSATSAAEIAKKNGPGVEVGSVQLRDSLVKAVAAAPQCIAHGRDADPYLAGTVTFYIHMAVTGSDVVRVQESQWTSQAGAIADKCFNEAATKWKFPMGTSKPGKYLLQVQFKPEAKKADATIDTKALKPDSTAKTAKPAAKKG